MTTTATLPPKTPQGPPLTAKAAAAGLLCLLWLELGYAAAFAAIGHIGWSTALWQAALCIVAIPPLLFAVVKFVSFPKNLPHLSRTTLKALWLLGNVVEICLPWLGWSTLFWLLNGGAWGALLPGGGVALFSYCFGILLLVLLRPRASDVQITRLELPITGLPAAFDGYTILHVTDLHCSYLVPIRDVRARVAVGAGLACDLVVFTGDIANGVEELQDAADALAMLRPRERAVAVVGNHDNWLGNARVRAALMRSDFQVLTNEHTRIERNGEYIYLAGVNNTAYNDHDDLPGTFAGIPEEAVIVLLSHAPDVLLRPLSSRAALILAGHTHGGQLVLPRVGPLYVPSRVGRSYASGLFQHMGSWLFVNRGLGEIFPPIRLLCSPEIALVTLRAREPFGGRA